ncbi:hypothetical protein BSU04_08080 [Caballeronia sordidicola]|uniref:Uncharacterized protein n=1 Tax=Caballeronia sordidicola TaxID=196367 RepID=A0A226X6N7_CABSO|nr:hypothetical protein BSU04_08080 [Caballeronia sordidicola]
MFFTHKHKRPLKFRSAGVCAFRYYSITRLGAITTARVVPAVRVGA